MHPNDLIEFRDNVAIPRMLQLFEKTNIPEGARYIDSLEFSVLDGRSCGVDSRIQASGFSYRNGCAVRYLFDECDADIGTFFAEHKDCVFISDGSLRISDELEEMDLSTRIRHIRDCGRFFDWFESPNDLSIELVSIEYEKLKYLSAKEQEASSVKATKISALQSDISDLMFQRDWEIAYGHDDEKLSSIETRILLKECQICAIGMGAELDEARFEEAMCDNDFSSSLAQAEDLEAFLTENGFFQEKPSLQSRIDSASGRTGNSAAKPVPEKQPDR